MNLPANFLNDIQGKDTSLIPLVVFESIDILPLNSDSLEAIKHFTLSTNNITVDTIYQYTDGFIHPLHYKPLLLNIPSIRQSVDIENRRFKISSVTLSISNYEYEGFRFSDLLQTKSLINKNVSIHWKSQSSDIVVTQEGSLFLDFIDFDEERFCPTVYRGKIRRISHTTDTVTVELEDLTESNAHKDLPQTSLPADESVLDKYRNKPIPMVYGHVDRSPLVFADLYKQLIADSKNVNSYVTEDNVFGGTDDPLFVHIGHYLNVRKSQQYLADIDFNIRLLSNKISEISAEGVDDISFVCHDSSNNFQVALECHPDEDVEDSSDLDLTFSGDSLPAIFDGSLESNNVHWQGSRSSNETLVGSIETHTKKDDIILLYDSNEGSLNVEFRAVYVIEYENSGADFYTEFLLLKLGFKFLPQYDYVNVSDTDVVRVIGLTLNGVNFSSIAPYNQGTLLPQWGYVIHSNSGNDATSGDTIGGGLSANYSQYHSLAELSVNEYSMITQQINFVNANWGSEAPSGWEGQGANPNAPIHYEVSAEIDPNDENRLIITGDVTTPNLANGGFDEIGFLREVRATKILDKDFYANVKGREYQDELAQNPAVIIRHILEEELGYTDFDEEDYQTALWEHSGLKYGFTVHDKQISSKKLIEGIAKSTLMFPHFGNDGKFRFNTMKRFYSMGQDDLQYQDQDVTDFDSAFLMPVSDVIDYSFSKTKPEQIYSKYEVDYYYDYAQKSHLKKVSSDYSVTDTEYLDFYGFDESDDNIGKLQSSYIRDEYTADWMNRLLYNHYKNQHLILKLKLPVKYIGLSVGDLVKFDELLGGITAYGRDYTKVELLPDTHQAYPLFYITSLQKNIDSVSIELMQLHDLVDGDTLDIYYYEDAGIPDRLFTQTQRDEIFRFSNFNGEESYTISQDSDISDTDFNDLFGMDKWYRQDTPFTQDADPISSWGDLVDVELNSGTYNLPIIVIQALDTTQNYEQSLQSTIYVMANWNTTSNQIEYNLSISNGMEIIPEQTEIKIEILQPIESGITLRYDPPFGVQESIPWVNDEEDEVDDNTEVIPLGAGSGDINEDGIVNILDIVQTIDHILNSTPLSDSQFSAADVNADGTLNILDIVQTVNIVLES